MVARTLPIIVCFLLLATVSPGRADDLLDQLRAKQHAQAQAANPTSSINALPPNEVYFSPNGRCTQAIERELNAAKTTVLVQAYSFTSAPIAKALVQAHRRSVKVEAVLDYSNKSDQYSAADFLARAGVPTFLDGNYKIAHNKIMIIDGEVIITGSFNFTKSAEHDNG